MDIKEKEIIEMQFERNLDLLIKQKFPLTATAIVSAEQPMILLFKELIHRIEKREYELDKKDKIINEMAEVLNDFDYDKQCEICYPNICSASVDGTGYIKCIIEYFTNKVEEGKGN